MTDELKAQYVAGLKEERRGYEMRLQSEDAEARKEAKERLKAVDAELQRLDQDTDDLDQYHVGGGWYELPDGQKVQGKEAAAKALEG